MTGAGHEAIWLARAAAICLLLALASQHSDGSGSPNPDPRPLVGVYYFPGWYRDTPGCDELHKSSEWRTCIMRSPKPRPLCGFYDDSDPKLWEYYADWMAGHGIDFIAFDWYYNCGQLFINDSLDKGFLGCDGGKNVRFALHWCNHPLGIWRKPMDQTRPELLKMIDLACERYFSRPNYLRIDGRPVFMIYDTDILLGFGGVDGVRANLRAIRGRAARHGFAGLYLVAVYGGVSAARMQLLKDLGYDALVAYTYVGARSPSIRWDSHTIPYNTGVDNCTQNIYPFLSRIAKEKGIAYWPGTFPGWDDRPRAGPERAYVAAGNTPKLLGKMFRGALQYVDPASPVVMIEAWNEWGEGACIEPDKEHGFGFLDEIARAVGRKVAKPRVPSDAEIASWSVLTPEELAAAKEAEKLTWELQPTILTKLARNRTAPPAKLPVSFEFAEGGMEFDAAGCTVERRGSDGLVVVSNTNDPQVRLKLPDVPTAQVKRITIEGEVLEEPAGKMSLSELFFITALVPDGSSFCMAQLPPFRSGKASVSTSEIMGWDKFGTPLTALRVDFTERPGVKFLLRRVTLE